jgi:hypothetical protein
MVEMFKKSYYKFIILPLLIFLISISGCLNADLNTKLNKDFSGTKTIHLEMAPIIYSAMEDNLSKESLNQIPGAQVISYKKDMKDNKVILDFVVEYKDLRNVGKLKISEQDKVLRYEDSTFEKLEEVGKESEMMAGAVSIKYTLEMPYKIEKSNADTIDGNKATWVIVGLKSKTLYAESNVPAIPGFTGVSLLIAGLIVVIIFRKQNK